MDRASVKFRQTGDKELWVIHGEAWSIPVYAMPVVRQADNVKLVAVRAATPLSSDQHQALGSKLAELSLFSTPEGAIWMLDGAIDQLGQYGERAKGVTPQCYLEWKDTVSSLPANTISGIEVPKAAKPEATPEMQQFIKRVWQRSNLAEPKVLSILYDGLCQEAQKWLLDDNKTLDLGFVKLTALPYRVNWKQILLAKFPKILRFARMAKDKREATLALTPFVAEIRNTDLWAINKHDNYFHWSIEATPTKAWNDYVRQQERDRLAKLSRTQYSRVWARLVKKLEGRIMDTFCQFVCETAIPCGAVPPNSYHGHQIVGPRVPKGRVRAVSPDYVETRVATLDTDCPAQEIPYGEPEIIPLQANLLPQELPPILFEAENMRDTWRYHTCQSGDGI